MFSKKYSTNSFKSCLSQRCSKNFIWLKKVDYSKKFFTFVMNQKNIALTLYCPDIPILILWGNSCNIFLVIGGVNWTQPFEMLKSLRPSLPLTAFHCVGVFGPLQCAHGPRDVKCFLRALTNSFQKIIMVGGQKIFSGGEVGFNKIVFGFLLNQPPAANQNSTKVHLSTFTN